MEEEAEKMVALKKAYADIILNTAKEAAGRVMASELKALRFKQDLCSAKDEGLRMLLRLKQMLDSKIDAAAITASSQQRRIEELEAQLQEAEEIIIDLRIELKSVQNELRNAKNSHRQPSNVQSANEGPHHENIKPVNNASEPISSTHLDSAHANLTASDWNTSINQNFPSSQCCQVLTQIMPSIDSHMDNSTLDSIVMRTDDPELYKKGCTLRCNVGNFPDVKLPPEDADDLPKQSKSIIKEDKIVPNTKSDDIVKNKIVLGGVMQFNRCTCKLRRRRSRRHFSTKARSCKSCLSQLMKPSQPSSTLSNTKRCSDSVNGSAIFAGTSARTFSKADDKGILRYSIRPKENLQVSGSCFGDKVNIFDEELRNGKVKYGDLSTASRKSPPGQFTKCGREPLLSHCKKKICSADGIAKPSGDVLDIIDSEAEMKMPMHSLSAVTTPGNAEDVAEEKSLIDVAISVQHEIDASKSLRVPNLKLASKMVSLPSTDADVTDAKTFEAINGGSRHTDNERFLKYTFQRKRKKGLLSNSDDNTSPGKCTAKRRMGDNDDGAPKQQKSIMINESTRDSRRLAQVAHQLISLSGKRWW